MSYLIVMAALALFGGILRISILAERRRFGDTMDKIMDGEREYDTQTDGD